MAKETNTYNDPDLSCKILWVLHGQGNEYRIIYLIHSDRKIEPSEVGASVVFKDRLRVNNLEGTCLLGDLFHDEDLINRGWNGVYVSREYSVPSNQGVRFTFSVEVDYRHEIESISSKNLNNNKDVWSRYCFSVLL